MGKRKERRLAALSNTGRRVKLDLFTEPSGDLGASDEPGKVGGDLKDSAESPNSPSSSGQQTHNPLLLLGQYSDDDLDEESDEILGHAIVQSSLADTKSKVEEPKEEGCRDTDIQASANGTVSEVDQVDTGRHPPPSELDFKPDEVGARTREAPAPDKLQKQTEYAAQASVAASSEVQVVGDVGSGWKMVLHEGSNQYYYWNTETGETSWEIPEVVAQAIGSTSDQTTVFVGNAEVGPMGIRDSNPVLSVEQVNLLAAGDFISESSSLISHGAAYDNGTQMTEQVEGYRTRSLEDKNGVADLNTSVGASQSDLCAVIAPLNQEDFAGLGNSSSGVLANDISAHVLSQAECLLEKLRSLKGSQSNLQSPDWISKYIMEAEVRLSDIKGLSSCGPALLPFWEHSDIQLKRLNDVVNNEIYQLARSAVLNEVSTANSSYLGENEKSLESLGNRPDIDESKENFVHSGEISDVCTDEAPDRNGGVLTGYMGSNVAGSEAHVTVSSEMVPDPGFQVVEDVDMDVDMELEDTIPEARGATPNASYGNSFGTTEQSDPTIEKKSAMYNDVPAIPPPPDEEWIPPPPPDNEDIPPPPPPPDADSEEVPPPPPDEFQEPLYPPPPFSGQPVSYTQQYNLTYQDPNYQYYGNVTATVPSNQFYGDEAQVTLPHISFYYGTVPGASSEAAPAMVNAVEPAAYYGLNKTAVSLPVPSNTESSFLCGSAPATTSTVSGVESNMVSSEVPSTCTIIGAPATISLKDSASQSAESADVLPATATCASTSTKTQSKVVRSKKRTLGAVQSLRANKKVSSLVDKWKAAKEELNESEEDEPRTAVEILESKRQKAIEEWRAKQIATGEAKDNANFQPLGGDWRERAKRKRAKAAREAAKSEPGSHIDEHQQPDLAEASKDLPPGWQAIWDESSKQIYYGNRFTSETSWTKPKK